MRGLKDKVVVVTGGGGGIGGATCSRFAAEGAKVAVFDMNLESAQKVADNITAAGGSAAAFKCDITDRAQVDAAVAAAEAQLGPIAVLVNNAGCIQTLRQDRARGMGAADRHQPDRCPSHAARRAARHGRAQVWSHRQRGL